jgi:hypothetical protein
MRTARGCLTCFNSHASRFRWISPYTASDGSKAKHPNRRCSTRRRRLWNFRRPVEAEEPEAEPRTHTEIQAKLRDIGLFEGYDVWVADRGTEWNNEPLGVGCLRDLPVVAAEQIRRVMRNIDVIWFRKGAGHPVCFFEIEHSTSVYSGLLRFNDVIIDFPIPEAFIVGDGDRTKAKFEREVARRTFEQSGLYGVNCQIHDTGGQAPPGTSEGVKVNARGVNFNKHVTGDNLLVKLPSCWISLIVSPSERRLPITCMHQTADSSTTR